MYDQQLVFEKNIKWIFTISTIRNINKLKIVFMQGFLIDNN
jgi:hypothetical protein